MIASPGAARVMVASDATSEAQQILRLLEDHFSTVFVSTVQEHAVRDFETQRPDVLVLAFDGIAKAQSYYLGLYRFGQTLQQHAHRTVLLCNKDELPEAFELCKKQYFDDYVLHWPFPHDGLRLPMSIWLASREMMAVTAQAPRRLGELEKTLSLGTAGGEQAIIVSQDSAPSPAARDGLPLLMIVDDDELTLDLLTGALKDQAYEFLLVPDGVTALRELQRVRPDVIFMDVGLPGLDGVSLTRRLKALPSLAGIPIIMITGDSRRETVKGSMEAGAADFVIKPFTRESVTAKLRKVLP
jgi:DNA-binding response OmpR family regulator